MSISDNIWWTRKARIQTEKRLNSNIFHAQLLLTWYALWSVFSAVYYLKFSPDSPYSDVVWVVFAVSLFGVSTFINGLDHRKRASLVKEGYELLSSLYHRAKSGTDNLVEVEEKYKDILGTSENHTDIDYYKALCVACLVDGKESISRHPTYFIWASVAVAIIAKCLLLASMYSMPVALFWFLELYNDSKNAV